MEYVEWTFTSSKFRNESGQTNQHGLTLVRVLGRGQTLDGRVSNIAVYEARCPLCQSLHAVWGNCWKTRRHCGCGPRRPPRADGKESEFTFKRTRRYWLTYITKVPHSYIPEWADYEAFLGDVGRIKEGELLLAINPEELIGPRNMVRAQRDKVTKRHVKPIHHAGDLWVLYGTGIKADGRVYSRSGIGRYLGISRQRVFQLTQEEIASRLKARRITIYTIAEWLEKNPRSKLHLAE